MQKLKMNLKIPEKEYNAINSIVNKFYENNYECYLIGGSVRDLILGHEIYDYDFATNAKPEEITVLFSRVIPTGIDHGTVSVLINQKLYEITTYRADGNYIDGRRPESISFSNTLEEDVLRRDFTINGLAYNFDNDEVIDYVEGVRDIDKKIIRTIGDPVTRFSEDGLRVYRACRLAAKLLFDIEDDTFNAIKVSLDTARKISVERIRDEFKKLLETERPSIGIEYLRKSGLLKQFLPELNACYKVVQNKYHIFDIYYHSIYSCDAAPKKQPVIRLASLFHDIGKLATRKMSDFGDFTFYNHEVVGARITRRILRRLRFSNDEIALVNNLVLNHMFHYTDEWTDGAVRRFMRKVGVDNLDDLFSVRLADRKGTGSRDGMPFPIKKLKKRIEKIIEDENAITVKDLDINGYIIMDVFDLKPGPIIGFVLNELLEEVLDNPAVNTRENLLSMSTEIVKRLKSQ